MIVNYNKKKKKQKGKLDKHHKKNKKKQEDILNNVSTILEEGDEFVDKKLLNDTLSILKDKKGEVLYNKIYYSILSYTKNPEMSQDIVQETFLLLHKKKNTIPATWVTYEKWMRRTARNLAIMFYRKQSRFQYISPLDWDINFSYKTIDNKSNNFDEEIITNKILTSLSHLTDTEKAFLILNQLEKISIKKLAHIFNHSDRTVQRALTNLKYKLKTITKEEIKLID